MRVQAIEKPIVTIGPIKPFPSLFVLAGSRHRPQHWKFDSRIYQQKLQLDIRPLFDHFTRWVPQAVRMQEIGNIAAKPSGDMLQVVQAQL